MLTFVTGSGGVGGAELLDFTGLWIHSLISFYVFINSVQAAFYFYFYFYHTMNKSEDKLKAKSEDFL